MTVYNVVTEKDAGGKKLIKADLSTDAINIILPNVPCQSSVFVGAFVYLDGSSTAINAIATSLATSNVLGVVESKESVNVCNVRLLGKTGELYSSLDVTKEYFLSDSNPGEMTTTVPTASGSVVLKLGQPYSDKEFIMLKGSRSVRL